MSAPEKPVFENPIFTYQNVCRVIRRAYFCAAHRLYQDHLTLQENQALYGDAATSMHGFGHNYILEAYVEGAIDVKTGMVMAIHELDACLKEITSGLDHRFLNHEVSYFKTVVPTGENIAQYCFDFLNRLLKTHGQVKLAKVRLYETDDLWVDIEPAC